METVPTTWLGIAALGITGAVAVGMGFVRTIERYLDTRARKTANGNGNGGFGPTDRATLNRIPELLDQHRQLSWGPSIEKLISCGESTSQQLNHCGDVLERIATSQDKHLEQAERLTERILRNREQGE